MRRLSLLLMAVLSDVHALWSHSRMLSPRVTQTSKVHASGDRRRFFDDLLGIGLVGSSLAVLPSSAQVRCSLCAWFVLLIDRRSDGTAW